MTADAGAPGAPRFDVVLRGYDRRQVDEHVVRLQRALARMRADLDVARSQPFPVVPSPSAGFPAPGQPAPALGPQMGQSGDRPRPTPRPRPGLPVPVESPDMIGGFTDRMQNILQAAEDEAAEIRNNAHVAARAETEAARSEFTDLLRQRDAVLGELTRMRAQLEGLLSSPTTRFTLPLREGAPGSAASPPAPGAPATNQRTGTPSNGSVQAGVPSPESDPPATSTKGPPAPGPTSTQNAAGGASPPTSSGSGLSGSAGKPAAHRLPTGAYPAVTEKATSMRPRTEPDPEPGELFRPLSDSVPRAVEPPRPDESGGRTAQQGTAVNPDASGDARSPAPATPQVGDVEATVQVGAVRPTASDATVLTPVVAPSLTHRTEKNEKPADKAPDGERSASGGNGSSTPDRPTSPSRSG